MKKNLAALSLSTRRNPLVIIAADMAVVLAAQAVVSAGRLAG